MAEDEDAPVGAALILLGLLALLRAGAPEPRWVAPERAGVGLSVRLETLSGDAFRLLPGVGPTLAARLEEARRRRGGVLDEAAARSVRGIGPSLLARWRALVKAPGSD